MLPDADPTVLAADAAGLVSRRCSPRRRSARSAAWPAGSSPSREADGVRHAGRRGPVAGWPHDRAHCFFSRARWNPDDLGLAAARLVVSLLVPGGAPVPVAIDDTLVPAARQEGLGGRWFHDGSAPGTCEDRVREQLGDRRDRGGSRCSRPVAVPVLAKLVIKDTSSASRLWLARAWRPRWPPRCPAGTSTWSADAAYAGEGTEARLPARSPGPPGCARTPPCTTCPARAPAGAAGPAKGDRLPALAKLAATAAFTQVTVTRYGKTATVQAAAVTCLWHSVFGARPVTVILIRDRPTRLRPGPGHHRPGRQPPRRSSSDTPAGGASRSRSRTPSRSSAPGRPATAPPAPSSAPSRSARLPGHRHPLVRHRRPRPRRRQRAPRPRPLVHHQDPASTADMTAKLRRVLIAARFRPSRPDQPTPEEINAIRLAWEDAAA